MKKRVKALEKSTSKEARLRIREGGCEFHSYVKEPSFREKRRSVHPPTSIKEVAKSKEQTFKPEDFENYDINRSYVVNPPAQRLLSRK